MKNNLLEFLGRDSEFGEKNNSAYIEMENKLIIIDCGFTVFEQLKKKFDFTKYENIEVIITHLHNDHAGSLSQLILYLWFMHNKKTTVYSKCSRIKEYLDITGTPVMAYEIKDESENLKFIKTEHVEHLDAYGFKLKINDTNIVYTGDTNTLEPFMQYLDDVNEFYVDVSKFGGAHIKIDDVLEILRKIKSNGTSIYLMHMDDKEYIEDVTKKEFYT